LHHACIASEIKVAVVTPHNYAEEQWNPNHHFLISPSPPPSVRPSASSTHTTKSRNSSSSRPDEPKRTSDPKVPQHEAQTPLLPLIQTQPTRRISLEHLAKLREREKNPTEPLPKKKNTPLVLNKHTFLHPTTLPTHTQSKQASK
jgi:hypothetical protein